MLIFGFFNVTLQCNSKYNTVSYSFHFCYRQFENKVEVDLTDVLLKYVILSALENLHGQVMFFSNITYLRWS